jgi:hypothetical protein
VCLKWKPIPIPGCHRNKDFSYNLFQAFHVKISARQHERPGFGHFVTNSNYFLGRASRFVCDGRIIAIRVSLRQVYSCHSLVRIVTFQSFARREVGDKFSSLLALAFLGAERRPAVSARDMSEWPIAAD